MLKITKKTTTTKKNTVSRPYQERANGLYSPLLSPQINPGDIIRAMRR